MEGQGAVLRGRGAPAVRKEIRERYLQPNQPGWPAYFGPLPEGWGITDWRVRCASWATRARNVIPLAEQENDKNDDWPYCTPRNEDVCGNVIEWEDQPTLSHTDVDDDWLGDDDYDDLAGRWVVPNGGVVVYKKPVSRREQIAQARAVRCVDLRAQGHTWQQIADTLGFASREGARNAYMRQVAATRETSEYWRDLQLIQMTKLGSYLWPLAAAGDLDATDRYLKVADRIAKLAGTDKAPAPQPMALEQIGESRGEVIESIEAATKFLTLLPEVVAMVAQPVVHRLAEDVAASTLPETAASVSALENVVDAELVDET